MAILSFYYFINIITSLTTGNMFHILSHQNKNVINETAGSLTLFKENNS